MAAWNIDKNKIVNYLLSYATVESSGKAKFFNGVANYTVENWQLLEQHLLVHPEMAEELPSVESSWGTKRLFQCYMPESPCGRQFCIKTIWGIKPDGLYWIQTAIPI